MPNTKPASKSETWTAEERAAMKDRAAEVKPRRSGAGKTDGNADVLAKIAEMPDADREMAERIHRIVRDVAPELTPRTWYGMPAYAKNGKVLCFFQSAQKFTSRYATLGFNDVADLDDGNMWPTSFALTRLAKADEERIAALVRQAVGTE